jgi:hypothetical protein
MPPACHGYSPAQSRRTAVVRHQSISVESGASFDVLLNFRLKSLLLAIRDYLGADLTTALQDTHDSSLVFAASTSDTALRYT